MHQGGVSIEQFPISRDPPEGGTCAVPEEDLVENLFPISRDPPEGGTAYEPNTRIVWYWRFQFLGIPPKGEQPHSARLGRQHRDSRVSNF